MKNLLHACAVLLAVLATPGITAAILESSPNPPDLPMQFDSIGSRSEALGFRTRGYPGASGIPSNTHYQGIVRKSGEGIPYFFVARSGMGGGDEGNVLVVKMGSRSTTGERLRSNRLKKDKPTWFTPPDTDDRVVHQWSPGWKHVGGLALVGDILAVPLEDAKPANEPLEGAVWFYDVSEPTSPRRIRHLDIGYNDHKAGVCGLTRLPDRHYLLSVTWGDANRVRFYRSTHTSLLDGDCRWSLLDSWRQDDLKGAGAEWPTGSTSFQGHSLHSSQGRVFLVGFRNDLESTPLFPGSDEAFLYEIEGWRDDGTPFEVRQRSRRTLNAHSDGAGLVPTALTYNGNFMAGACTHVTPAGELLVYAIEHNNHGPEGTVRIAEWRHTAVAHPGSDLFAPRCRFRLPDYMLAGSHPIEIGSVRLYGMRPWIQLHDSDDFAGARLMIDYDDTDNEDYQDLRKIDGGLDGFNDRASSLRWWAPPGWRIRLHDSDNFGGDEPTLTLDGNGRIQSIANLSEKPYEFDNGDHLNIDETRVTSVRFLPPDFDDQETILRQVGIEWFVHSTVEGAASITKRPLGQATLELHKPGALVSVRVRLTGPNGEQSTFTRNVRIVNTAPRITSFSAEHIGFGIVQARMSVEDPGNTGSVIGRIHWGDGTSSTREFQAGGTFGAQHQYADNNPAVPLFEEFNLVATVTDPDGATDAENLGSGETDSRPQISTNLPVRVTWRTAEPGDDNDTDGLPDLWEQAHFRGTGFSAEGDNDGDGVENLRELIEGTDPADPDDIFTWKVNRLERDMEIQFETRSLAGLVKGKTKRVYRVESNPGLLGENWRMEAEPAGTGDRYQGRVPIDRDPMKFFRVIPELR